jgi:uncharacterized protein (DUF433 family)
MNNAMLLDRIVIDSNIMLGKPVIRGTRLPIALIVEKLAYGATFEDLKTDYPFITEDDVRASLMYAARCLSREEVYAA